MKRCVENGVGDVGAKARQVQLLRFEKNLRCPYQPAAVIDDADPRQRRAPRLAVLQTARFFRS